MPSAELAPGSTMTSAAASAGATVVTTSPATAPSTMVAECVRRVVRCLVDPDIGASRSVLSAPRVRIRTVVSTAAHYGGPGSPGEGTRAPGSRSGSRRGDEGADPLAAVPLVADPDDREIGRASCRERV